MTVQTFRSRPVEIQAMQWNYSDDRADELWDWTAGRGAHTTAVSTRFMVLGEDDAYEVFGCLDEDGDLIPGNKVEQLKSQGFTAVLYVQESGQWAGLRNMDWVVAELSGSGHYPCTDEVLRRKYEEIVTVTIEPGVDHPEMTIVEGETHARPVT